jgi:adenylate cyclase
MTTTAANAANRADASAAWHAKGSIERALRMWSGIVLMVFVTSHFLNHALGIFGIDIMTAAQSWRIWVWRSMPGTTLLGGAAIIHATLALKRAAGRRTFRMPALEALQIALGILIPFMLLSHVAATRVVGWIGGADDSYVHVLRNLWPSLAASQSLALLVVWGHGVIGIHSAFHMQIWFKRTQALLAILAALIPALALAGFVAAGREAATNAAPQAQGTPEQFTLFQLAVGRGQLVIYAGLALLAGVVLFRFLRARLAAGVTIRYLGHGEIRSTPGQTLLEVSRSNGIPHPSSCGGRGRCSSCRVLVLNGQDSLPKPVGVEQRMLERIRAPVNVRLACQIRPTSDINVRVLMEGALSGDTWRGGIAGTNWGIEENLAIVVADIRGFATLASNQLPADFISLLNRVIGEMAQAVEARGGRVTTVQTDGVMAVFGMGGRARDGSRAALNAAADMLKAVHALNKDIGLSLPMPIRVGIGVHCGEVVLSHTQDAFAGERTIVVGEAAVVANRLEEATKELAADCVVSAATLAMAGLTAPEKSGRQIHYKNGATPVVAHAFSDRRALQVLLGRRRPADAAPEPTASPAPA